jgi:hypothetical protein
MSEPHTDVSIETLIQGPPEAIKVQDIPMLQKGLIASAKALEEVAFYEQAMGWARTSAREAHEAVLARDVPGEDPAFPELRLATLSWIVRCLEREAEATGQTVHEVRYLAREVEAETAARRLADRAREAAFKADPGRWLPGATRSPVTLFQPGGCWLAERDGEQMLCCHADASRPIEAQRTAVAAFDRACREGYWRVIVIGAPGLSNALWAQTELEVKMWQVEIEAVEIAIDATPVSPAPTGGRVA